MATYNGHNEDSSGNILLSIGNGMTATVETGTTASQAYTKGSYLFFNNRLCKATSAISSGATLAIGTNLSQTSIGQEITSHLRSSDGKEFYFDIKDGTYGYYPSASKTASEFVPFGGTSEITLGTYSFTRIRTTVTFTATEDATYLALVSCHEGGCSISNSGGSLVSTPIADSATVAKVFNLKSGDTLSLYASGSSAGYVTVCNAVFKIG